MEYNGRHMIAVGSSDVENVLRARNKAAVIFRTCVSSVVAGNSERYQAFSIGCAGVMPGSCSDCADARRNFRRWLRCVETDGPAAQVDWVEVKYNNKGESLVVMASSDPSNLTFDGVAVLAAILGLSVGQLSANLYAIRAVCGTDNVDPKNSYTQDKLLSTPYDIQQFSSLLSSVCPGSTGYVASEFPPEHLQTNPDADLLRLCGFMLDTKGLIDEVYGRQRTLDDERCSDSELTSLSEKSRRIEDTIYDTAAPRTLVGAQAMARLALATWPTAFEEGKPAALDFREWLSLSVMEFLAKRDY